MKNLIVKPLKTAKTVVKVLIVWNQVSVFLIVNNVYLETWLTGAVGAVSGAVIQLMTAIKVIEKFIAKEHQILHLVFVTQIAFYAILELTQLTLPVDIVIKLHHIHVTVL